MKMLQCFKVKALKAASFTVAMGLTILALQLFTSLARADQQGYPYTFGNLANIPNLFTNGTTIAASNNIIPLRINSGLGMQALVTSTNSATTNGLAFTLFFFSSVDNTNYTTSPWTVWTIPLLGTNAVVANTNWSQLALRGIASVSVLASNGSGSFLLTGGYFTNATGLILPLGVDFNRPNQ